MNTQKIVSGALGGKQSFKGLSNDADKDGVMNVMDCQPDNPNKQGWLHDAAEKLKEKYEEHKQEKAQEAERVVVAKEEGKKVYAEERQKALIKQETERAKARAQPRPSFFSTLQSAMPKSKSKPRVNNFSNNLSNFLGVSKITKQEFSLLGVSKKKGGNNLII